MRKFLLVIFSLFCLTMFVNSVSALEIKDALLVMSKQCGVFTEDVLTLMQDIFDAIKFITPILVIVLSALDYTKVITSGDKDKLSKVNKNTIIRLILGACLFLLPTLINFFFELVGWYGTCGIS